MCLSGDILWLFCTYEEIRLLDVLTCDYEHEKRSDNCVNAIEQHQTYQRIQDGEKQAFLVCVIVIEECTCQYSCDAEENDQYFCPLVGFLCLLGWGEMIRSTVRLFRI